MKLTAEEIAGKLGLVPHPEGGFYREIYRSEEKIPYQALPDRYRDDKSFATSIYYLITKDTFSAMHRLKSDELVHFYLGVEALIAMMYPNGKVQKMVLGNDITQGDRPQILIPRGVWFGIRVTGPGDYTLTGITVAPGFGFDDFELGKREELISLYPQHSELIKQFTREE